MKNYDCRLKCLANLLQDYGHDFSPAFIFGFGEGYTFKYWVEKTRKIPLLVISGRKIELEYTFLKNLGISFERCFFDKIEELESITDSGIGVFVNADRFYLPYLKELYPNTHFGYHSVIVNKNNAGNFKIYDALPDNHFDISSKELFEAMSSDIECFSPNREGFYLKGNNNILTNARLKERLIVK